MTASTGQDRARLAFEHAVLHERWAIAAHDQAEQMHKRAADRLDQVALRTDAGPELDALVEHSEREREFAAAAADRAATARKRLRDEGVAV